MPEPADNWEVSDSESYSGTIMVIHGTGCCLIDCLYTPVDFSGPFFKAALSLKGGDGGVSPGRLVFAEDLERFTGKPYQQILAEICGGVPPSSYNLGGPSAVSLAHAAQMFQGEHHSVCLYAARGTDETGSLIDALLAKLPFDHCTYLLKEGDSARTDVLSDPAYDKGHGERTFIHLPGTASLLYPEDIEDDFFNAHIIAFGGTALLPHIHDSFTALLRRSQQNGALTLVNLVYDYWSEITFPGQKWKLGIEDDAYPYIDVLIADRDEALNTSGQNAVDTAAAWFLAQGIGAIIITQGVKPVLFAAQKGIFTPQALSCLPVCEALSHELAQNPQCRGDTTGCGDNFAGGIITAIAEQLTYLPRGKLSLREACIPAIVAGGFACFTLGGVFYETRPGEKKERLSPYITAYRKELGIH